MSDLNKEIFEVIENGDYHTLINLLEKGININILDDNGNTALHLASTPEIVKLLLDKGANPEARNNQNDTPLIFASFNDNTESVKLLLEKGADPNAQNSNGNTPLIFASSNDNTESVKLLLEKGANPEARNNQNDTPLIFASFNDNTESIKLLLEKGADPNTQNSNGNTALIIASLNNYTKLVKLLLEKGANLEVQNNNGDASLSIASSSNNIEIVKLLLEKGANPNIQNKNGNTPLIIASLKNNLEILKLLLEKGVDINIENNDGETVIEYTSFREIIELLFDKTLKYKNMNYEEIIKSTSNENLIGFLLEKEYEYPKEYSNNELLNNLNAIRTPINKDNRKVELENIIKNCESICTNNTKHFCKNVIHLIHDSNFGFVYKNKDNNQIMGFSAFEIRKHNSNNKNNKNKNLNVDYGILIINGILRCSNTKGIGRVIQSDQEDFAKENNIQVIKIYPADKELKNNYYIPIHKFQKEDNEGFLYKKISKGGNKRKTRKQKNKLRKHKSIKKHK